MTRSLTCINIKPKKATRINEWPLIILILVSWFLNLKTLHFNLNFNAAWQFKLHQRVNSF
jgi:hypothetical protein